MVQSVTSPDGTTNEFPDDATPEMIAKAMGVKYEAPAPKQDTAPQVPRTDMVNPTSGQDQTPPDPVGDKIFAQTPPGSILGTLDKYMGFGWMANAGKAAFQTYSDIGSGQLGMSEETEQNLRDIGWFNDYKKGQDNFAKTVLESVLKPAAYAADTVMTAGYAIGASAVAGIGTMVTGEKPDTASTHAQDFTQFLMLNSGFSDAGMPLPERGKPSADAGPPEASPGMTSLNVMTGEVTPPTAKAGTMREGAEGPPVLNIPIKHENQIVDASGNLNLDYVNATKSTKDILAQTAQAYAEKNGTTIPNVETKAQAQGFLDDAMKQVSNGIPDVLASMNRGDPVNRDLLYSARQLVVQTGNEYLKLAKAASETGAQADIDAATEAYTKLQTLQGIRHEISAEAGRTIQSHVIKVGDEGMEAVIDKLTSADMKPEDVHDIAATLDTPQQIAKFAQDAEKPGFGDMFIYYVMNNYLSGPITHAAYAASYAVQTLLRVGVETPIAAAVGKVQRLLGNSLEPEELDGLRKERSGIMDRFNEADSTQGRPLAASESAQMSKRLDIIDKQMKEYATVMPHEVAARFYGIGQGFLDSVQASWQAIKTGQIPKLAGETERGARPNPIIAFGKNIENPILKSILEKPFTAVGTVVGIPTRMVGAIHTFQKFLSYSESLNALAYRQAATEGLEGSMMNKATALGARMAELRNDPPKEMMEAATDEGLYASLMGKPGKAGGAFERWANSSDYTKIIVPFARVMNNINSQALLERGPLGLLSQDVRADIFGKNGNAAQATAIGKMATGTAILGAAATLTAKGFINGEAPDDKNEKAFNYLAGKPPYSVRIGDMNVPLRFFGIPGRVMAVGADLHDIAKAYYDDDSFTAALGMTAHAVGNDVLSESGMRGIAEAYQAINDYDRYGQYYIRNTMSSMLTPMSVGMGQLTRATDPNMRQAQTLLEAFKSKNPFTSQTLIPKVDIFGNPMQRNNDYEKAMNDPVMQALSYLQMYPAPVSDRLSNVKLTEDEAFAYATMAGKIFYENARVVTSDPHWVEADPNAQFQMLQGMIKQSRKAARGYMHTAFPDLNARAAQAKMDLMHPYDDDSEDDK